MPRARAAAALAATKVTDPTRPRPVPKNLLLIQDPKHGHGRHSSNAGIVGVGGIIATPEDMGEYVNVYAFKAKFTLRIDELPSDDIDRVCALVEDIVDEVEVSKGSGRMSVNGGVVNLHLVGSTCWISWMASPKADLVADAITLLLMDWKKRMCDGGDVAMETVKTADVDRARTAQVVTKLTEIHFGDISKTTNDEVFATSFDGATDISISIDTGFVHTLRGDQSAVVASLQAMIRNCLQA